MVVYIVTPRCIKQPCAKFMFRGCLVERRERDIYIERVGGKENKGEGKRLSLPGGDD